MQLYSHSEILHFQNIFVFWEGGEHALRPHVRGPKKLSPHCMPVKVLGHTNLPFFHTHRVDSSAYHTLSDK